MNIAIGVIIPFLGTAVGAALVFFLRTGISIIAQKGLLGFAAGIMMAASVWSLLIPAIELSDFLGNMAFLPVSLGMIFGVLFLLLLDKCISRFYVKGAKKMLFTAVSLHNIPEGMVVGTVFAGMLVGDVEFTPAAAFALSVGIGIQNIPEGAIISLPLKAEGKTCVYAWLMGVLSGLFEPIAAVMTLFFLSGVKLGLPYMLSMAAGAMIYVVVKELIPEAADKAHGNIGCLGFVLGFVLMMILDVAFA